MNGRATTAFHIQTDGRALSNQKSAEASRDDTLDITYNSLEKKITITKNPNVPIDIRNMTVDDDYNNHRYTLTLNETSHALFQKNEYQINDNWIDRIQVERKAGKTKLVIDEKAILGYLLSEDEWSIYIHAVPPKQAYKKIVIIDPGHGGADSGTERGDFLEKDIVLDVSNRLAACLTQQTDIKVYATRTTDAWVDLKNRAAFGNWLGDLFVSIHINDYKEDPSIHGCQTFYYLRPADADAAFAAPLESRAAILNTAIVDHLHAKDRGTKSESYAVLRQSTIPAVLVELGFISNRDEATHFRDRAYRQQAAEGLCEGITKIFDTYVTERS